MFKKKDPICPLIKKECVGDGCAFWITIMGKHPQSGQDINMPDCAVRWIPTLLIENSKVGRETGAAVEGFRNEMVNGNNAAIGILKTAAQLRLTGGRE